MGGGGGGRRVCGGWNITDKVWLCGCVRSRDCYLPWSEELKIGLWAT